MALTILTAGLAACGLLLLLWSVAEAMLLPLPREDAVLVAPLQGGAAEVERQIRGCRWMREHRGLRAQIIWIDRGLTPEGQEAAARLLRDAAGSFAPPGRRQNIWSGWGPLRPEPGRPGRMGELALGAGAGQRDDRRCGL